MDEALALDLKLRETIAGADELRSKRNTVSKQIGVMMAQKRFDEAEAAKPEVNAACEGVMEARKRARVY